VYAMDGHHRMLSICTSAGSAMGRGGRGDVVERWEMVRRIGALFVVEARTAVCREGQLATVRCSPSS